MVGAIYQTFKLFLIIFSITESITLGSTLMAERVRYFYFILIEFIYVLDN